MKDVFLLLVFYSFLGYLLERMFAKLSLAPQQVRKCFLLLPLCPVYGLAMVLHLSLLPPEGLPFWPLVLQGALVTTGVEYLVHLFYDKILHVRFWDYTGLWGQLRGRVCLPFSIAWGLLSALAVHAVQPELARLAAALPAWLAYVLLLLLAADAVLSWQLLRRYGDTELLSWRAVAARLAE